MILEKAADLRPLRPAGLPARITNLFSPFIRSFGGFSSHFLNIDRAAFSLDLSVILRADGCCDHGDSLRIRWLIPAAYSQTTWALRIRGRVGLAWVSFFTDSESKIKPMRSDYPFTGAGVPFSAR